VAVIAVTLRVVEYGISPFCRLGEKRNLVQNAVLFSRRSRYGVYHGGFYDIKGACLCQSQKNEQASEGLGRSCGGFSSKIHAVCDALGNPLDFIVSGGQVHDATQAIALISGLQANALLADKGYDSDAIRDFARNQGIEPHIPPRQNRVETRFYDKALYKERHKIECLFGFMKHCRRLFSRFDKTKRSFTAFLHFAAALQWLK
jgi:transposase